MLFLKYMYILCGGRRYLCLFSPFSLYFTRKLSIHRMHANISLLSSVKFNSSAAKNKLQKWASERYKEREQAFATNKVASRSSRLGVGHKSFASLDNNSNTQKKPMWNVWCPSHCTNSPKVYPFPYHPLPTNPSSS